MKAWVPLTYQAFMDYRMGAANISAKGMKVIKRMVAGEKMTQEESGMSKGEWRELMEVLGQPVPDSNLVSELKSAVPQQTQR